MFYPRFLAWSIWMIASLFYAYQYILRVMPNIMMGDITRQFNIDATLFGQFSGVYYIGYSLMHLPIGIMLDRFGPKKIMTGCILLTVIGLLPILLAEHWVYPIIGRCFIGIGSSAAILGTFKIIRLCFKERYFSRMLSFSVMIGLIGAVYGGGPVSYLCTIWGYKAVVQLFVMIGLLLAITTYFVVPQSESSPKSISILTDVKTIFMDKNILSLCCFGGLMLGPLEGFSDVWGAGFFQEVYGFNKITSNTLTSMIFIGMCFGSPVLSLIAEKTGYYLGTIALSGMIMFLVFCALVLCVVHAPVINASLFLVGVCCAYQILLIYKVSTYAPERLAGLATAVANMIIMIFGYAFHSIIGLVISSQGGTLEPKAFIYGISVIPLGLLFGILGCVYISYKNRTKIHYNNYAAEA